MKQLWNHVGETHPYWGVFTSQEFFAENLQPQSLQRFFESGEAHITTLLSKAELHFGPYKNESALDFGCGVGRLLVPLAKAFREVKGVDISPSMIKEAEKNCLLNNLSNVSFTENLDLIPKESFDFVHSFIVLQHIPPSKGMKLISRLIELIKPSGIGALHVTYKNQFSLLKKAGLWARRNIKSFHYVCNVLQKRKWDLPVIPMYVYNLPSLLEIFRKAAISDVCMQITQHGAYSGALFLFKKS